MVRGNLYCCGRKKHGQRFSLLLRVSVDLREEMLSHAVPNGAKTCRLHIAAKSAHRCWQLVQAIYFWALDQDNNNDNNNIDNKDRRRSWGGGGGGGSGIATAPEMLRLTSAINTTKTSVIPVCTLTRFMSANVFQGWPCANHCTRHWKIIQMNQV